MGWLLATGFAVSLVACGEDAASADQTDPDAAGPATSSGAASSSSGGSRTDAGADAGQLDLDAARPGADAAEDLAPSVTITSPREGIGVQAYRVRVTGTAHDDVAVTSLRFALGSDAPVDVALAADGSFAFEVTPAPGDNVLSIAAGDASGNTTTASRHVHYGSRVSVGNSQAALLADGQLFTWGRNELGQLGNGSLEGTWSGDENAEVPARFTVAIPALASVVTRQTFMLGLTSTGEVYSWGSNDYEQLGRETPADCGSAGTAPCGRTPVRVADVAGAAAVAAGFQHSLVLLQDGSVVSFGSNALGQLGPGAATPRRAPAAVAGLSDIVQLAAGSAHSMALTRDGRVFVWGSNQYGQLGSGVADLERHTEPVQIAGISDAVAIASANYTPMVLLADGTIRAWGQNANGQVGNGSTELALAPAMVLREAGTPLTNVESLAADGFVGVAVDRAGVTHTWGFGFLGQLGRGLLDDGERDLRNDSYAAPVAVPNGGDAASFVALEAEVGAGGPAFVWTSAGELYGWGWSFRGSLGGGTALLNAWAYTTPLRVYPTP